MEVKCNSCGKMVTESFVTYSVPESAGDAVTEAMQRSLGPYLPGEYHVCWECTLSAVGVPKPEG